MLFRQLFDPVSSTYTYLLGDTTSRLALLIDPVISCVERDIQLLSSLNLTLAFTLDTHIHADHITGALSLKQRLGSKIANPKIDHLPCADVYLEEGTPLQVGNITVHPLHTPGHTAGHFSYLVDNMVFTGDSLLIDGCGRTDFQQGDAGALYHSIHQKLFTLPDDTLVYPGHDYQQRTISTIAQEKARNPRLGNAKSEAEFIAIMQGLHLPNPILIDYAVQGNQLCGVCPETLPDHLSRYCEEAHLAIQG